MTLSDLQSLPDSVLKILSYDLRHAEYVLSLERSSPSPALELIDAIPTDARTHLHQLLCQAEGYEYPLEDGVWEHGANSTISLLKQMIDTEIAERQALA